MNKKYIDDIISTSLINTSSFTEFDEIDTGVTETLDQGTPSSPSTISNSSTHSQFDYFITIAFPQNESFEIKHLELNANNVYKTVFSKIKYKEATQNEQYSYIIHKLNKHIQLLADKYDIFFEQTKTGELHCHGRIERTPRITKKDLRVLLHRIFQCPIKYKQFIDIQIYDHTKWNNYENKTTKNYQTLNYPHFKNI